MAQSGWSSDINDISSVAKKLESDPNNDIVRRELLSKLDMLKRSVQQPVDLMDENWITMSCIKASAALLDHGVLQSIPMHGKVSAGKLAEQSALDRQIIVRLMRFLTANGIIDLSQDDGEQMYAHTHLSRVWLQRNAVQHSLMMVNNIMSPDVGLYLRTHVPEDIHNPSRCMSAWGAGAEGMNFWEYISSDAKTLATFDEALQYTEQFNPAYGTYPIEERLTGLGLSEDAPLVVDVGSGRGQSMMALRSKLPELRGRLICQDRADVLASIPPSDRKLFEVMEHDFFIPQPVLGARIYFLRWIIHDWDDDSACRILAQLVPALSSSSRVLIQEALLPERAVPGVDLSSCWMDYAMMMIGGRERTETEMLQLLQKAGLQHISTWRSDSCAYSVIEAGLPGTQSA